MNIRNRLSQLGARALAAAAGLTMAPLCAQADVIFEPEPVETVGPNIGIIIGVIALAVIAAVLVIRGRKK